MGKDLHYSIRPFIKNALIGHKAVKSIEEIDTDEYYVYKITRNFGYSDVLVVLSDAYTFNHYSYLNKPDILKNGGFFLVARPEASVNEMNDIPNKTVVGRLSRLLGALNKSEFWTYEPPQKDKN